VLLAHLSDTHLLADPDERLGNHNPAENLSAVVHALPEQVDVMVVTGDVAENGNPRSYHLAKSITAGRADRTFFVQGNHDDPDAMQSVLGDTEELRTFSLSDRWTLALVNTQWLGHDAGRITDVTMARLQQELGGTKAHVVRQFDTMRHGIRFLGAPSTFRQLRHGGDPHYTDTGEPPAGQLLELRDDGGIDSHVVTAG
jgi:3',5'-cyclic AMP phosphodiesterase CpdA